MRLLICTVVVAVAVLGSASRADALCAPQFWVGTPDGSYVPTRGALYVYSGSFSTSGPVTVPMRWIGKGTAEQEEIAPSVFKITYSGVAGSVLVIDEPYGRPSRYQLTSTWRAPTKPPTALAFVHDAMRGCPSWDVLRVTLDERPAAIRIRWRSATLVDEWVMPASKFADVGKIGCARSTVPREELDTGGHLELIAIRLDGSEVAVTGIPERISVRDVPAIDNDALVTAHMQKIVREQEARRREPPPRDPRIGIAIALLIAGLVVARAWLRHELARVR